MSEFSPKKLYQSSSLQTKVNIIFCVLLVIPMVLFSIYATGRMRSVMQEQTLTAARKTFDEALGSLNSLMAKMSSVSDTIAKDSNLPYVISVEEENRNIFQAYRRYLNYASTVSQLKTLSGISDIRLYSDSQFFTRPLEPIRQTDWFASLYRFPFRQWFSSSDFPDIPENEEPYFSYIRLLHSRGNYKTYDGVLQINVPRKDFMEPLLKTTVTPNSAMLLLTADRILLEGSASFPAADADSLSSIVSSPYNEWQVLRLQGVEYHVICSRLELNDWTLAVLIPATDMAAVSSRLCWEMIGIMLALAVIAYLVATTMAHSILKRIMQLTNATWQLESGDTDIRLASAEQDELGSLMVRFDQMAACIDRLMEEKVRYGQRIQNLELQALQAQINPHFLYNTLDTINCLAIRKNAPEISGLVSSLAGFYRISLSKGREQISIRDEVTHAKMYLNILDSRFPGQIRTTWDIPPEIEDLRIIKIVLQPIIENAAIHGIYERENGSGSITIRGRLEGDDVYLTITDDGVGMTQEVIDANFRTPAEPIPGGYGIRNICERIRIAYGGEYGLSCVSEVGRGTTVTIHIPRVI